MYEIFSEIQSYFCPLCITRPNWIFIPPSKLSLFEYSSATRNYIEFVLKSEASWHITLAPNLFVNDIFDTIKIQVLQALYLSPKRLVKKSVPIHSIPNILNHIDFKLVTVSLIEFVWIFSRHQDYIVRFQLIFLKLAIIPYLDVSILVKSYHGIVHTKGTDSWKQLVKAN